MHDIVGEWRGQCDCNAAKLIDVTGERDQLKAENDELRNVGSQLRAFFVDATEQCCKAERERDQLRAEIAGLKTGYEAYEQVVQGLKAENEALRVDAERYRWLRNQADAADWEFLSHQSRETVDQNIDCALTPSGKGEQS